MATENLAYYDANVWAAWMLGKSDPFFSQAKVLINRITSGETTVVVSNLILLEVIHVIRKRTAEYSKYTGDTHEDHTAVRNKANMMTLDLIRRIREMAKNRQVLLAPQHISIMNHHTRVLTKIVEYFGHVHTVTRGPTKKYRYKGLGHTDLEHAVFAQSSNVQEFYSGDTSFEDLRGDSDFGDMIFNIIRPSKAAD